MRVFVGLIVVGTVQAIVDDVTSVSVPFVSEIRVSQPAPAPAPAAPPRFNVLCVYVTAVLGPAL